MKMLTNIINRYSVGITYIIFLSTIIWFSGCKSSTETRSTGGTNQATVQPSPTQIPKTDQTNKINEIDKVDGYILTSAVWKDPVIPVCWESMPENQSAERGWVQEAVENAWDVNSDVDFTGWGLCEPHKPGLKGIRIAVNNTKDGASTAGLGNQISGKKNAIKLVFAFDNWRHETCTETEAIRQSCIRAVGVHEFGHGLGFAHEHRRPDTPSTCDAEPGGSRGDRTIGVWDANSIMNYCNKQRWYQSGILSQGDIASVRDVYGPKPANTD